MLSLNTFLLLITEQAQGKPHNQQDFYDLIPNISFSPAELQEPAEAAVQAESEMIFTVIVV